MLHFYAKSVVWGLIVRSCLKITHFIDEFYTPDYRILNTIIEF